MASLLLALTARVGGCDGSSRSSSDGLSSWLEDVSPIQEKRSKSMSMQLK